MTSPPFNDPSAREEFRSRLNELPVFDLPPEAVDKHPGIELAALSDSAILDSFLSVLDWSVDRVLKATEGRAVANS